MHSGAPYATIQASGNPHVSISSYPSRLPPPPTYAAHPQHQQYYFPHGHYGPPGTSFEPHPAAVRLQPHAAPIRARLPATSQSMSQYGSQRPQMSRQPPTPTNPPNNYVYIFSTELANSAAKAVIERQAPSLIEYHKAHTSAKFRQAGAKAVPTSVAQTIKKELSPPGAGGSASSGYESSATPPFALQHPGPQQQVKSEPSPVSCRPIPSPQSVPPAPPRTPLTPLGRANSVNPTGGPPTPQSAGPATPTAPLDPPTPSASGFSQSGDDPLSKMARLANESLPLEPPLKRSRMMEAPEADGLSQADASRSAKMRRIEDMRKMFITDGAQQQAPYQPPPQGYRPPMMMEGGYGPPPHYLDPNGGGMMMMHPGMMRGPPGAGDPEAQVEWQKMVEVHQIERMREQQELMSRAGPRGMPRGAPRQLLRPTGPPMAQMRAPMRMMRPPPYAAHPMNPQEEAIFRQQQQQFAMRMQGHPQRPPPQMVMSAGIQGGPSAHMSVYGEPGLGHPGADAFFHHPDFGAQHPHFQPHPQHTLHPHMQGPPEMGNGGLKEGLDVSKAGGMPTVNNTYVNATMSIQQLNIQNLGPPLSAAQVHAHGHVALSVARAPPHLRPAQPAHPGHPGHPAHMRPHGDLQALLHQPITNLDSKVPSKTLQYRPAAPVEVPPPPPPSSAASDFPGLLGEEDDSFGFDSFESFQPTATFASFEDGRDGDLFAKALDGTDL